MTDPRASTAIILCADDYAISPGVSAGIRELLAAKRLSATSCMAASPYWPDEGPRLRRFADDADVGIHISLTGLPPLGPMPRIAPDGTPPSFGWLTLAAYAGALDAGEIEAEIGRQLDAFMGVLGRPPAHVDGHLHVHQLPVVREAVLDAFRARLAGSGAWLRVCDEPLAAIRQRAVAPIRASVISAMGRALRREATALDIPTNRRFTGVQNFDPRSSYRALFRRFIADAPPGLLVMCHPGHSDPALARFDLVVEKRDEESRYFASDEFVSDLAEAGCAIARFKDARLQGMSAATG